MVDVDHTFVEEIAELDQRREDLAKRCDPPSLEVARQLVEEEWGERDRFIAAAYWVYEAAVDLARVRTRDAERRAERRTPEQVRGAMDRGKPVTDEERRYVERLDQGNADAANQLWTKISESVAKYTRELRIEWTQELLGSEIALRDGRRTTWGAATRSDHEERVAIFEGNAVANLEGAARHRKALAVLDETGAVNLNAAVNGKAGGAG